MISPWSLKHVSMKLNALIHCAIFLLNVCLAHQCIPFLPTFLLVMARTVRVEKSGNAKELKLN